MQHRFPLPDFRVGPLLLASALIACAGGRRAPNGFVAPRGPDFARGDTAEKFAPGVVSDGRAFALTLTHDGRTAFFTRANAARTELKVMRTRLVDGRWTPPEAMPFADVPRSMDPHVAPDGATLYFTSARRREAQRGEAGDDWDTWMVPLAADGTTGAPRNAGAPANTEHSEMYPSVTRDGWLYYGRFSPDSATDARVRGVWRARPGGVEESMVPVIGAGAGNPYVTPDGRLLLFTSGRPGGHGRGDLWGVARRADGSWTEPVNLGREVNGDETEFCPQLSPDGRWLFFSRIGYRGEERVRDDVWVIRADAVPALRSLRAQAR